MEHDELNFGQLEELSAWMDGELDAVRAAEVERLVAADPAWRAACAELLALEAALDRVPAARPRVDLTDRIVQAAESAKGESTGARRIIRWLAPITAAAAVAVIAVGLWLAGTGKPVVDEASLASALRPEAARELHGIAAQDQYIVLQLPMFTNMPEVTRYETVRLLADPDTLAAIESLEELEDNGADGETES